MSELLAVHIVHLRAAGMSPKTIHDRARLLRVADRTLPHGIDTPTVAELEAFLAQPGWSAWTRATYFRHLLGFYRWATTGSRPRMDWNPAADLIAPRNPDSDPHPVTDAELGHALANSPPDWQLAIALAAYAGLRAGEVCRLRREHVTETDITVWHGKGDRTLRIPTHPEIWRRVAPLPPGLVFPAPGGGQRRELTNAARKHFDALGMPDVHLHRFRHWYACALLAGGADIVTVRDLMRHKSIQTTEMYLRIVNRQREIAITALPAPTSPLQSAA